MTSKLSAYSLIFFALTVIIHLSIYKLLALNGNIVWWCIAVEVSLWAEPVAGNEPLTVTFKGRVSNYQPPIEWLLDYRDGFVDNGFVDAFERSHVFEKAGEYEVVLGSHDAVDEKFARVWVSVQPVAPVLPLPWFLAPLAVGAVLLFAVLRK